MDMVDKKHTVSIVKTVVETLHTMTVSKTTPSDSGVYKAVVTNTAGEVTTEAPITIKGKFVCL